MIEKARVGLALQPVCTALFANSPLKEGKPTGERPLGCLRILFPHRMGRLTVSFPARLHNSVRQLPA